VYSVEQMGHFFGFGLIAFTIFHLRALEGFLSHKESTILFAF